MKAVRNEISSLSKRLPTAKVGNTLDICWFDSSILHDVSVPGSSFVADKTDHAVYRTVLFVWYSETGHSSCLTVTPTSFFPSILLHPPLHSTPPPPPPTHTHTHTPPHAHAHQTKKDIQLASTEKRISKLEGRALVLTAAPCRS